MNVRRRTHAVICLASAVMALAGCTDRRAIQRQAELPPAQRLAGVWHMRIRLDQPLAPNRVPARDTIAGEIALLPNPWLVGAYPEIYAPTNYGAYDIDLRPFGFDPRDRDQVPVAIAAPRGRDSVDLVLAPGRATTVALRGVFAGDSIVGVWHASVVRFGASGRFVMTRKRAPAGVPAG